MGKEFKLNNNNYKEIEYIINEYIGQQKLLYKNLAEEVFFVEIVFLVNETMAIYESVEKVRLIRWNNGLRIFMDCNGIENSFFYTGDMEIYSEVEIDAIFSGGIKKSYCKNSSEKKYTSKTIYFRQTEENTY